MCQSFFLNKVAGLRFGDNFISKEDINANYPKYLSIICSSHRLKHCGGSKEKFLGKPNAKEINKI